MSSNRLIVPGISIGPVRIGMTPARASASLGTQGAMRHLRSNIVAWPQAGLYAYLKAGRIVSVEADDLHGVAFRTVRGISTESKFSTVVAQYGTTHCQPVADSNLPTYRWYGCVVPGPAGRATAFTSDIDGLVAAITVGRTGFTPLQGY